MAITVIQIVNNMAIIYKLTLLIMLSSLLFTVILIVISQKDNKFNHIEPVHKLETSEIIIDKFTAHRIKFALIDEWRKYRNISLEYNNKTNSYTLIINHISEEHKEETLNKLNIKF